MLKVLYLVHDVYESAVRRRVLMFQAGGASVCVAGFRRAVTGVPVPGAATIELGKTEDGNFTQRMFAVAKVAANVRSDFRGVSKPEIIIARNLEMLTIAVRARSIFGDPSIPIVYECLDVHRLMLRRDGIGAAMRATERYLTRNVSLLLTSSPAFLREYFSAYNQIDAPVELIENKHLELDPLPVSLPVERPARPWRIGWFGALRCRRSLDVLSQFASDANGGFEVTLRGKPAPTAIPDFEARTRSARHLSFQGPYRNPEDIESIYRQVHFAWLIDFFEEGQNSKWLLPNRLYEGSRFGAVPIALEGTETAAVLAQRNMGIILPEATPEALAEAFDALDDARYARLNSEVLAQGITPWVCDRAACRKLVARLIRLTERSSEPALAAA